jgi:hypothetical protein
MDRRLAELVRRTHAGEVFGAELFERLDEAHLARLAAHRG